MVKNGMLAKQNNSMNNFLSNQPRAKLVALLVGVACWRCPRLLFVGN